jgi:hypothetical protein
MLETKSRSIDARETNFPGTYFMHRHFPIQKEENCIKKTQIDVQLILSIFRQPLHVSGLSTAHHQEVQPYVYNWYLLFFLGDSLLSRLD